MGDNIQKHTFDAESEALKGDIAKILDDAKVPDAPAGQPVREKPPQTDFAQILEDVKLPETRDVRTSGDIPVAMVMPHGPPMSADLVGTKPAQEARQAAPTQSPEGKTAGKESSVVTPLRTLKDDMSAIVRGSKISLVRAAALEEEKKSKVSKAASTIEEQRAARRMRHTFAMIFAILLLVGIGAAALFGVYTITRLQRKAPAQGPESSLLFAEHAVSLVIGNQSPDQIKQILAQARTTGGGAIGSIARIVPMVAATGTDGTMTRRTATLGEFFHALGTHAPDDLLRALGGSYFFGIHTVNKNAPVLVVPVISYGRAFAGMLAWEPNINADLVPVFAAVPAQTRDENGLPVARTFQDAVMNNYDVRELKDDDGNIMLYYSFPTTQLLVIAESPFSFIEILSRLQAGRRL